MKLPESVFLYSCTQITAAGSTSALQKERGWLLMQDQNQNTEQESAGWGDTTAAVVLSNVRVKYRREVPATPCWSWGLMLSNTVNLNCFHQRMWTFLDLPWQVVKWSHSKAGDNRPLSLFGQQLLPNTFFGSQRLLHLKRRKQKGFKGKEGVLHAVLHLWHQKNYKKFQQHNLCWNMFVKVWIKLSLCTIILHFWWIPKLYWMNLKATNTQHLTTTIEVSAFVMNLFVKFLLYIFMHFIFVNFFLCLRLCCADKTFIGTPLKEFHLAKESKKRKWKVMMYLWQKKPKTAFLAHFLEKMKFVVDNEIIKD